MSTTAKLMQNATNDGQRRADRPLCEKGYFRVPHEQKHVLFFVALLLAVSGVVVLLAGGTSLQAWIWAALSPSVGRIAD